MVHMGFALRVLSSFSSLCSPRQRDNARSAAKPADQQQFLRTAPALPANLATVAAEVARPLPACAAANDACVRPLRVILRQQDDGACRLVISGRMADVCAELDRMALH
ncbi:MAG: hypothetical protein JSR53_10480 [Proteobacteria bacterium]|nr:hypothetical protein [Pseudomonadota bacterium]